MEFATRSFFLIDNIPLPVKCPIVGQYKCSVYIKRSQFFPSVIFLTVSIIRICYYNNKGDEITKYFIDENHFIVNIDSYNQNIPSSEYAQAIIVVRPCRTLKKY